MSDRLARINRLLDRLADLVSDFPPRESPPGRSNRLPCPLGWPNCPLCERN
jgi:hypothetical protein